MSNIKVQGDVSGTGTFTIAAPNGNTDRTLTLPDETGTVLTSASPVIAQKGVPAFRAYQSSSQSLSGATTTKIQLQTKSFDTTNAFDNTTNYRFQPTVAGYYFFEGHVYQNFGTTYAQPMIYKNGGAYKYGPYQQLYVPGVVTSVYLNGSSDYVELYCYVSAGITLNQTGQASTVFSGFLVRAA